MAFGDRSEKDEGTSQEEILPKHDIQEGKPKGAGREGDGGEIVDAVPGVLLRLFSFKKK